MIGRDEVEDIVDCGVGVVDEHFIEITEDLSSEFSDEHISDEHISDDEIDLTEEAMDTLDKEDLFVV